MLNKEDDLILMAQQSLVYDIIKNFLKTDLAREANISGISVKISEGYVNAEWKFDKRCKGDIKEDNQTTENKERYLLWIDDIRPVPEEYLEPYHIIVARSYEEAIEKLLEFNYDCICLDHDLGEQKTGYDVCKYIIENNIKCDEYRIHTKNPVGRDNMYQLLYKNTDATIRIMN